MTPMQNLTIVPKSEFDRLVKAPLSDSLMLQLYADLCRVNALTAIKKAGSGHIGSSFSAMDIVVHLYLRTMNTLSLGVGHPDRDVYFSSKGHDAPGLYAALYAFGVLPLEKLARLRRLDGLDGHPDLAVSGIEANSGSLGMGIAKARGIAKAKTLKGEKGHVFVLLGDGELQEGQIWESVQASAHQGMPGVTVIVDRNGYQTDRSTEVISPLGNLRRKFEAFGWACTEIDGHDHAQIDTALSAPRNGSTPYVIIANTVKGRGISFMEGPAHPTADFLYRYHSGAPTDSDYEKGIAEITGRCQTALAKVEFAPVQTEILQRDPPGDAPSDENIAGAFGDRLLELGSEVPALCVLVADLADDCKTRAFAKHFPERFIENGIAEQDMCSMAGGMARMGLLPVVNSFGCFLASRPNEQIYNNFTEGTRIIYAMHLSGLIPAGPGKSHQSLRDISLMGGLPGIEIIQPASAEEARQALTYLVKDSDKSGVLRMNIGFSPRRIELPSDYRFTRGHGTVLTTGSDAVIFSYGPVMLNQVLKASEILRAEDIGVTVVNMPWLNVADDSWLSALLGPFKTVLTVDDHSTVGGLGDFLLGRMAAQRLIDGRNFIKLGVEEIPVCGTMDEVLKHHKLDAAALAACMREALV